MRLTGVGVGPGDPEHLTLKALAALRRADRVFVPGDRAEAVVAPHVPRARLTRLHFAMRDDAARAGNWDRAGEAIAEVIRDGGEAAFATIGDPNLYSTFAYIAAAVRVLVPGVVVETVPGITALQDLAARSGTVLTEGDERLALVPWTAGADHLRAALESYDTVVVYKGGRELPRVLEVVEAAGRIGTAVLGEELGATGEAIAAVAEREGTAPYMSTLIVARRAPRTRDARLVALEDRT